MANNAAQSTYNRLRDLVTKMEPDMNKFSEKINAAAGRRVRKVAQESRKLCVELRKQIQSIINEGK